MALRMPGDRSWTEPWLTLGLFAFLLYFTWEMLQAPFYAGMDTAGHWPAVLRCTQATVGDVVIAWGSYGVAARLTCDRFWLRNPRGSGLAVFLITGLAVTVALEWLNVHVWRRWAYGEDMPVVLGAGLTPLLQWVIVPLLTLWLARRDLGLVDGGTV